MSTNPRTIERRLISKYFRQGLLGEAIDQTDYCPVSIPGVDFDETAAADTTPFTPAQVRDQVGFIELRLREVDSWDGAATSGVDASGARVSTVYTLTRCRFVIKVPGGIDDREGELERREERLRELFVGLDIVHAGPPKLHLRQLPSKYRPKVWADTDNGSWRRRILDIQIRRRERRTHAGVQGVTL